MVATNLNFMPKSDYKDGNFGVLWKIVRNDITNYRIAQYTQKKFRSSQMPERFCQFIGLLMMLLFPLVNNYLLTLYGLMSSYDIYTATGKDSKLMRP